MSYPSMLICMYDAQAPLQNVIHSVMQACFPVRGSRPRLKILLDTGVSIGFRQYGHNLTSAGFSSLIGFPFSLLFRVW